MALANLVSDAGCDVAAGMLAAWGRMIPPGEMGEVEQGLYYEAPPADDLNRILEALRSTPSLAKQRLSQYERQLSEILGYFKRLDAGEFMPLDMQLELFTRLGFNAPKKARTDLEVESRPRR